MSELLAKTSLTNARKEYISASLLKEKVVLLYFSAHWCPPCRKFTPLLKQFYEVAKSQEPNFEIVFVSNDKTSEEYDEYLSEMPWVAIKYDEGEFSHDLAERYQVEGIPSLIVIDAAGKKVVDNARDDLIACLQKATSDPSQIGVLLAAWSKAVGGWKTTAGSAVGGGTNVQQNDMQALREARLRALEARSSSTAASAPPAATTAANTPNTTNTANTANTVNTTNTAPAPTTKTTVPQPTATTAATSNAPAMSNTSTSTSTSTSAINDDVLKFVEVTGCDVATATSFMESFGVLDSAITAYYASL